MGNEQPDTPIARKCPENGPAREDIHVIGRLVHDEHIRILPKCHGNLQTLLLTARKRVVAPGPVIVDAQIDAQTHGRLLPRARKVLEPVGRNGRILLAIRNDQATRRYRTAIRRQHARRNTRERTLATTVVADDARPPHRKNGAHAVEDGLGRSGIRIGDVVQGYLHGNLA